MLGQIDAQCGLFTISAKPKVRWRQILHDFIPYIQGQKVDFEITVKVSENLTTESCLSYSVENVGNLLSWVNQIKVLPIQKGETIKLDTVKIPLYRTGDSLFTVWQPDDIGRRQAAYIFHTTSKNTVFLTGVGILITALAAVITLA